ncbi:hypothetical protein C1J01_21825 [Nonomuraea aridisoli]|uniref:Uncharacterized protein n=1 Tax=Nonomuraea aridisoli TaxID=2070368 RepID=A0A2W2FM42_9ACTN|nr:hypothetical protein C1J01_21825 [Nonomuraea aridisoli]
MRMPSGIVASSAAMNAPTGSEPALAPPCVWTSMRARHQEGVGAGVDERHRVWRNGARRVHAGDAAVT